MDKMLDKYLNILSKLDAKVERFKEEDDERRLKFIQMVTEAKVKVFCKFSLRIV